MRISDWVSDLCSSDLQILAAGCVEIAKTGTTKREQAIFGPGLDLANGAVLGRHRAPGCRDIIRRSRGCRTFVGIPVRRLDLVLFVKLDLILAAEQAAARRRWQAEDVVPLVDGKQALGEVWIAELQTHLILAGARLEIGRASCRERGCQYV